MLTTGDLRKLIEGKPDDWEVPLSIAYDEVCDDYVFVRVDDMTAGPTKPKDPPGNIHDDGPAIFVTVSLVDGNDSDEDEEECDLCGDFFTCNELVDDLCRACNARMMRYAFVHDTDRKNAIANLRIADESKEDG